MCVCVCGKKNQVAKFMQFSFGLSFVGPFYVNTLERKWQRKKGEKKTGAHAGNKLSFGFRPQSESSQQETLLGF